MPVDGETLTRWTVRIALVGYFVAVGLLLHRTTPAKREHADHFARIAYTLGCAAFLVHVTCAFHFHHAWSHARAYDDTARQTRELLGVDAGAGIWFNYLFTVMWLADVIAMWTRGVSRYRQRSRWLHVFVHGFFVFIIFNATVVFETGFARWLGVVGLAVLLVFAAPRLRQHAT